MDLWQRFWSSGSISDYLDYRSSLHRDDDTEVDYADDHQGLDNQRADDRGE